MNFSLTEYWGVITKYINPFTIIGSALISTFIAFVVFLVIVLVFRKIIRVKRSQPFLNLLSIAYMILIPLLAALFGFKWGVVNGFQKDIKSHIGYYAKDLSHAFDGQLNETTGHFLFGGLAVDSSGVVMKMSTNALVDTLSQKLYDKYGATLESTAMDDGTFTGKLSGLLLKVFRSKAIAFATKKGINKMLSGQLGVDKETTATLMEKKLVDIAGEGLFPRILEIQLEKVFGSMKKGVFITFSLILLLPALEVFIAWRRNKRKHQLAVAIT